MTHDPAKQTIAVDFDGVLHSYTSPWTAVDQISDPPVEGALGWLREMVGYYNVTVFTTRARSRKGAEAVRSWLADQGLEASVLARIVITADKPPALIYLDDRAVTFTGKFPSAEQIGNFQPWNKRDGR